MKNVNWQEKRTCKYEMKCRHLKLKLYQTLNPRV